LIFDKGTKTVAEYLSRKDKFLSLITSITERRKEERKEVGGKRGGWKEIGREEGRGQCVCKFTYGKRLMSKIHKKLNSIIKKSNI
jgi:hypothetical protein